MRDGDWARAWAISDAVLRGRDKRTRNDPGQPYHIRWVWDGTAVDGRDVLVRCYHGLGDTLQFCRFLPALRRRARHVTLEVQPELQPFLAGMADLVVTFDVAAPRPPAEVDIEIMELSHVLRLGPEQAPPPYVAGVPAGGLGDAIGLCWQAGDWDPERSVPREALVSAVSHCFVELARRPGDLDIGRTAALVAGLKLIVTVDTMVAHLAGALGRPGVVLLKHDADWRWMRGESCAWYPSLRLLRQHAPGDWSVPLSALTAIRALAAG